MSVYTEQAMLVRIDVRTWTGRKSDREASEKTREDFEVKGHRLRSYKDLIDSKPLRDWSKLRREANDYLYAHTMPWQDEGARILPSVLFFEFADKARQFEERAQTIIEAFFEDYENAVARARLNLGRLFKESDYPNARLIRSRFRFKARFMPIADSGDWRVDMSEKELKKLRADVESQMKSIHEDAMRSLWDRLYEVVEHMVDRLDNPENKFKDSLVSNLSEVLDVLPKLNITKDPALTRAVLEARKKLIVNPDTLRKDPAVRSATAASAKSLITKISAYATPADQ